MNDFMDYWGVTPNKFPYFGRHVDENESGPDKPGSLDHLEPFCPACLYDLRGLTSDRCPECGEPFDRERFRTWATGRGLRPTFGPGNSNPGRSLFILSLTSPSRLGRELPPGVDGAAVSRFAWSMRFVAIALATVVAVLTDGEPKWWLIVPIIFGPAFVLGSLTCDLLIAESLTNRVKFHHAPQDTEARFRFSLALCRCFSSYLSLIILFSQVMLSELYSRRGAGPSFGVSAVIVGLAGPMCFFLWWWLNLSRAILVRSEASRTRTVALLLITIWVGVAALVGVTSSLVLASQATAIID